MRNFILQTDNDKNDVEYHYRPMTTGDGIRTKHSKDHPQFVSSDVSERLDRHIEDILLEASKNFDFKIKQVERVKINLTTPQPNYPKDFYSMPHQDIHVAEKKDANKWYSLLYYVNDSDGDTYFFDEDLNIQTTITPRGGTAVLFQSKKIHSPSPPRNTLTRVVINYVFEIE